MFVFFGLKSVLFFISMLSFKLAADEELSLNQISRLNKVLESSGLSREDLGLAVSSIDGNLHWQVSAGKNMIPASLSKIPTAIALLDELSPEHEFKTEIWRNGEVSGTTLKGDLYLKGMGEPAFVSERMWYLVNTFIRSEIKTITGDIIVDESFFDEIRIDPGRVEPSEGRAFDAPVSALSFNWNSVNIFVRPGPSVGSKAKIFADPLNDYIKSVENKVITAAKGEASIDVTPQPVFEKGQIIGDKLIVSGRIGIQSMETVKYRSISDPALWTGANLKEFLLQRGVEVKGEVRKGKLPSKAVLVVEALGGNLRSAVADMMKFSNNFVAEMLTKYLSTQRGSIPGTMNSGLKIIAETLEKIGLKGKDFALASPSGLSRNNRMSAQQLVTLLSYATRSTFAPEFWSALPLSGRDGTLKGRMKGAIVRAKTGLLNGVSGLSGRVQREGRPPLLFAFIYNGRKFFESRELFDQLCLELAKNEKK